MKSEASSIDAYSSLLAASSPCKPTPSRMPYRPEAELKRPDLKGEFVCATCQKTFCHAASLNRHRLNFHGGNHFCTICKDTIPPKETVRRHMSTHGYDRIFTCGCCNWAFPDKKELHIHTSSMAKFNQPGSAQVIATTSSASGDGPAIGVFKEPKRIREARAAAKAAAAASPSAYALPDFKANLSRTPPTIIPSCSTPMLPMNSTEIYTLISQLMRNNSQSWLQAFSANNPLLAANPELISTLAANLAASRQLIAPPAPAAPAPSSLFSAPLTALDLSNTAELLASGLPSGRSEAQDTESDRVSPSPERGIEMKPTPSMLLNSASVLQFAKSAKPSSSLSPLTSGLSMEDCSSPSSAHSLSPLYDEKNNNSGSDSGAPHSIASLLTPAKEKQDSCSSSSDGGVSSPEQRHTPSPPIDMRKRRRTINDVVSFLHHKQVKTEE